jgi:hypothetical protein
LNRISALLSSGIPVRIRSLAFASALGQPGLLVLGSEAALRSLGRHADKMDAGGTAGS